MNVDKIKPEKQLGFEFRAEDYESPGMKRMQEQLTLRAIELLGLTKGKVIDIGCGTGYSTCVLVKKGFDVVGIDPNKNMIEKARERGLDCREGSFEKIPFKDREFDALISVSSLQWANYKKAAKETNRVMKNASKGVMQFYPDSDEDALRAAKAFAKEGFKAQLVIDNPNNPKKKKVFLVIKK